jgi:lysophospholipase L1-like esterase
MKLINRMVTITGVIAMVLAAALNSTDASAASSTGPLPMLRTREILRITLIGDSYTAGNGAGNYYTTNRKAYRSYRNWGHNYANYLRGQHILVTVDNQAVNGHTTDEVLEYQIKEVSANTDMVMMTIGGNDADFGGVVEWCFLAGSRENEDCIDSVRNAKSKLGKVREGTEKIFKELEEKLRDDATIILIAYPYISQDIDYKMGYCYTTTWFGICNNWMTYDAADNVRDLSDMNMDIQRDLVEEWNKSHTLQVKYINRTKDYFHDHEPHPEFLIKNDRRWLNEFFETDGKIDEDGKTKAKFSGDYREWYHPNITGHQKIAEAIINQLRNEEFELPIKKVSHEETDSQARFQSVTMAPLAAPTTQGEELPLLSAHIQGPYVGKINDSIEIDARASYSVRGDNLRYDWDFDGDGTYEFSTYEALFEKTFYQEYDGVINLKITDSNNYTATAASELIVSDDGDSTPRGEDNCPDVYNYSQSDYDGDGIGDECDPDPGYPTADLPGVFEIVDGVSSIPLIYEDGTIHYPDGSVGVYDKGEQGSVGGKGKGESPFVNTVAIAKGENKTRTNDIAFQSDSSSDEIFTTTTDLTATTPTATTPTATTPTATAETITESADKDNSTPIAVIIVSAVVVLAALTYVSLRKNRQRTPK